MDKNLILKKFFSLPLAQQREILNFMDFLSKKTIPKKTDVAAQNKFSFSWEGGLSELKQKTTSVELQHQADQWR